MGRNKLPKDEKKDFQVTTRVNQETLLKIKAVADDMYIDQSTFIRIAIFEKLEKLE